MPRKKITIATRKSPLAMWQTEFVRDQLQQLYPDIEIVLLPMLSSGDVRLDAPLYEIGGKGLFMKELELALLNGSADIAVHSLKDVPARLEEPFSLAAILQRGNVHDALVGSSGGIAQLPENAIVGTSSKRRKLQLLAIRPDLQIIPVRGNVQTRLATIQPSVIDAVVLAQAGLERLGIDSYPSSLLSTDVMLPAAGQGALTIECVATRTDIIEQLAPFHHQHTAICCTTERDFVAALGLGCTSPVAAYATLADGILSLQTYFVGSKTYRQQLSAAVADYRTLGQKLAAHITDDEVTLSQQH